MNSSNPNDKVRQLQQQPERQSDRKQQQSSGSGEYQPGKPQQQMGEGSYAAAEDYKKSIKSYLKKADVKADAMAAKPASSDEAEELKRAEQEGKSHSKARGE